MPYDFGIVCMRESIIRAFLILFVSLYYMLYDFGIACIIVLHAICFWYCLYNSKHHFFYNNLSEHAEKFGYHVVDHFVGHGVGTIFHSEPIIIHNRK